MSGTNSLALQNRPKTWNELMGQPIPQTFFINSLTPSEEHPYGKVFPAYLLHGTTGCGKTSSAMLFAKRLLCENPQGADPCNTCPSCVSINRGQSNPNLEVIDGTTDRGITYVTSHIEPWLTTSPLGSARFKVMIIDEFHRYTGDAKSAFLILLEELRQRNPRAIVVLCTTEFEQIDPAIRGRCIPLHYAPLDPAVISASVVTHLQEQGITVGAREVELLVDAAQGSMRAVWQALDTWMVLQQPLTEDLVYKLVRGVSQTRRAEFWQALSERQLAKANAMWEEWRRDSAEPCVLGRQLTKDLRKAMIQEPLRAEWIPAMQTLSMAQLLNDDETWLTALMSLQIPLAPTEVLRRAKPNAYVGTMPPAEVIRQAQQPEPVGPDIPLERVEETLAAAGVPPQFDPDAADYTPQAAREAYGGPEVHHTADDDSCARCGKIAYPGHLCKPTSLPDLNDGVATLVYLLGR